MRNLHALRAPGAAGGAVPRQQARPNRIMQAKPRRSSAIQAYGGGNVDVTFTLQRQVNFGQSVVLIGSAEELGAWELDRAPRMEWSEGRNGEHHWSATVSLPAGAELEYKFVIEDKNHEPMWESCWNRQLTVNSRNTELYGYWNQPIEQEEGGHSEAAASGTYVDQGSSYAGAASSNGSVNGKVKLSAAAEAAVSDIIAQAEASGAHEAVPAMAGVAAGNGGGHKVNGWESRGRSPARAGASLSPEQRAFLERKAAEARGASTMPSRLNGAAPTAVALSPEQQEFLDRKRRESSATPAPAAARGRSPAPTRGRSPTPVRAGSSPAPRGLSPDQRAFLERKQRETSASPSPARGRSPVAVAAPAASAPAAAGLTPDQQAFLERKRQMSSSPVPAPTRGRSPAPARGSSAAHVSSAPPRGLSPDQQAFLERKQQVSRSPAPVAASARASSARSEAPRGLSPEQQAFLDRKKQHSTSPAPSRGRSSSNGSSPAPAGLSAEQIEFMRRSGKL